MHQTRGRPVAFLDQRPRQVYLGAVHGEDPVPFPSLAGIGQAGLFKNSAMETLEHGLVQLGPGVANRRGRNRLRLGQRDPQRPALVPQFGERDRVALPVLREHQPENEQHDQQGVQHPAAALPYAIMVMGDRDRGPDDITPQPDERIPGGKARRRRPAPPDGGRPIEQGST